MLGVKFLPRTNNILFSKEIKQGPTIFWMLIQRSRQLNFTPPNLTTIFGQTKCLLKQRLKYSTKECHTSSLSKQNLRTSSTKVN